MGPNSPGELIDNVRFEKRTRTPDGAGGWTGVEWAVAIASRRVKLDPVRGGEETIARRQQGVSDWTLWVPWDSQVAGVNTDFRVVDNRDETRTFNIKFAEDMDGEKRWILMQLQAGAGDG